MTVISWYQRAFPGIPPEPFRGRLLASFAILSVSFRAAMSFSTTPSRTSELSPRTVRRSVLTGKISSRTAPTRDRTCNNARDVPTSVYDRRLARYRKYKNWTAARIRVFGQLSFRWTLKHTTWTNIESALILGDFEKKPKREIGSRMRGCTFRPRIVAESTGVLQDPDLEIKHIVGLDHEDKPRSHPFMEPRPPSPPCA